MKPLSRRPLAVNRVIRLQSADWLRQWFGVRRTRYLSRLPIDGEPPTRT